MNNQHIAQVIGRRLALIVSLGFACRKKIVLFNSQPLRQKNLGVFLCVAQKQQVFLCVAQKQQTIKYLLTYHVVPV
jgi:hypothetical protein